MRAALASYFDDTLNFCFNSVLETMGTAVREVISARLESRGIPAAEVPGRFDDVVKILHESFGGSARVLVYKTLVELHQQYSMRVDFTYQDSFKEHLALLRERVLNDHLVPRRVQRDDRELDRRMQIVVHDNSPRTFSFR